ncbi:hypothetical protein TB1_038679 [Malus domestica]
MNVDKSWNATSLAAGFGAVIRDGDEALRDPSLNLSPIEQVVEDCKALLNTITEANITHIRQNTNAAAHRLAKVGLSLMQSCEWTGSPPSILTYILVEDCV